MLIVAGAVAGVAAVSATVVVVNQLTAPAPHVEAVPTATSGPRQPGATIAPDPGPTSGAGIAEPFAGTTPQAGQYLRITTNEEVLIYRGPDDEVYQWSFRRHGAPAPLSAVLIHSVSGLYMPADRAGEWYSSHGPMNERVALYPGGDGAAWDSLLPIGPESPLKPSLGGIPGEGGVPFGGLESYAEYPADAHELLGYLDDRAVASGRVADGVRDYVVDAVLGVVRSNIAPAQTRATFLDALKLLEETEVVSVSGGITTYRVQYGQSGLPHTVTISVDAATGWTTEYSIRWGRTEGATGDMVPTSVPDIHWTYEVSIVDALP
ncbi:MAG: hypothetical protein J7484_04250 [Microbacterium sp.]|nr:hypothetical protein [Microbacterium sp.]